MNSPNHTFEVTTVANGTVVSATTRRGDREVFVTTGDPTPGQLIDAYLVGKKLNPDPPLKLPEKTPFKPTVRASPLATSIDEFAKDLERTFNDISY